MPDDFNPYHVWLSIRPEEQPPNHYRLLGLQLFETNADVIDSAADRQMAHLRTFQSGKHGDLTQRLLNEVAAARVCLLDPKKRAAYDQQLRAKMPAATLIAPPTIAIQPAPQPVTQPARAPVPLQRAVAMSAGGKSANPLAAPTALQSTKRHLVSAAIALGVMLIAGIGFGVYSSLTGKSEGTLVFDWPDRSGVTLTVDGAKIEVPASGAWEQNFPPGPHHVVAQRPAYKLSADVKLAAGQRVNVPPDWQAKATLKLAWPLADRAGAVLKVDGRPQTVSQVDPLELPVEPGQHRIEVLRPGVAPFSQLVNVAADERPTIAVTQAPKEAKLVLDWPVEQRGSAELTVDGRAVEASSAEPFELTLPPGQHVVRIARPGFEAFVQNVELSLGTNDTLKPTWTPVPKTPVPTTIADTPVPVAPVDPTPPQQPVKKQPIPAVADQEKIAKQLNDLYKTSQAGPKDPAKAQELYDVAAKDAGSPAERYMLLMKGAEIAALAGDLSLSLQGIDTLDADYEIDALEDKQKLLEKFIVAGKPDQVAIAIPTAEQLVDQAIVADRFDIAIVLAASASKAVAKSKIATHKEVEERLAHRRRDIHSLEPIHVAAKKAQETLEKSPDDPEANLTVGRWLCFDKQDWTAGLPLLAKGSDEKLKALAEQDIKAPTEADERVKLADAWWELAQKESGLARDSIHLHAGNIYRDAMPNLASVLKKASIEKRLAEIADLKPLPVPAPVAVVANNSTPTVRPGAATDFPLNQWVDILRFIDPARAVDGKWSRNGNAIAVEPKWGSRIAIPVAIIGSYDLAVKFTPNKTEVSIPVGAHGVSLMLGGGDGTVCGFDTVDGRRPFQAGNPTYAHLPEIASGQECVLLVRVRIQAADQASIDVLLDGKPLLPHWQGNPATLAVFSAWTMPKLDHPGLGAWDARATFSYARLRMITGHAAADASATKPALPIATSDSAAASVKLPLNQWVDLLPLVDLSRDSLRGTWTRSGAEISCASSNLPLLEIPVVIDGAYDLEVDFTRADGSDSIDTIIPIATRACSVKLSGWAGKVSGLGLVDGRQPVDAGYTGPVWPGTLENGHGYRLLIHVRLLEPNRASIAVSLDGKDFLPPWTGDPSSLMPGFKLSNPKYVGLAANWSHTTYHAVRLKMNSGQALVKATPQAPPTGGAANSGQLRFTKWEYKADERGTPGYFQKLPTGWVEMKEGKVWARFVEVARTADHVEIFDQGRGISVRMTPTEAFWSRDKVNWNSLAKGTPVEEPRAKDSSQDSTQESSSAPADSKQSAQPPAKNAVVHRTKKPLRFAEKTQLEKQRKEILAKSGDESDELRRAAMLIEAAGIALRLGDEKSGIDELENVISTTGHADYSNPGASALLTLANYWQDAGDWAKAEDAYMRTVKSYRGSYGDKGCEAAAAIGAHYEAARNIQKVIEAKKLVIKCGGSYMGPAGEACLWLGDYYLQKRDTKTATDYLQQVIDKYNGPFGQCKAKAEAKLAALGGK